MTSYRKCLMKFMANGLMLLFGNVIYEPNFSFECVFMCEKWIFFLFFQPSEIAHVNFHREMYHFTSMECINSISYLHTSGEWVEKWAEKRACFTVRPWFDESDSRSFFIPSWEQRERWRERDGIFKWWNLCARSLRSWHKWSLIILDFPFISFLLL